MTAYTEAMPDQDHASQPPTARAGVYTTLAILCGAWFLLTGWIWTYLANLFFSYPVAVIGLLLWRRARQLDPDNAMNRVALALHAGGLVASLVALLLYK